MDFQAYIIDASVIISIFYYKLHKNKKQDAIYYVVSFQNSVYYQCIIRKGSERDGIRNFTSRTDGKWKNNIGQKLRAMWAFSYI
ncbi:hypothetical protein B7492_19370 [Bacillus mycoides]|uniref:Uncharacterized protein n=1 Tax=Bacillus mycoides TaxID=1405 RepID=A0A1W6ABI4_BACMY|nr:hypothetical protein B7492_19370 [Bacillus mycoides]TKI85909.1 hypothetical protein FC701_08135 [Bacillus mycoides]